jgi:tellurite resistance protein
VSSFLRAIRQSATADDPAPAPVPDARADATSGETDTVRRIVARLDAMPPEHARHLAAFAYILARAANADLDISDEESAVMESALVEVGGLDQAQAVLVVQIAKFQARTKFGTEDFLVTREFAGFATDEEKAAVIRSAFAVSAADDEISSDEADTVNEIAHEIGMDRPTLNAIREAYVDKFSAIRAARLLARDGANETG